MPTETGAPSSNQPKRPSLLQEVQPCWRRFALWFTTVYLKRKQYIPGDTCRFVCQKVPEVQRSFIYYRIFHALGNLVAFGFSFLHVGVEHPPCLCEEPLIFCSTAIRMNFEWFFYATSVGLVINLIQSVWGLVLALATYCRQTRARKAERSQKNPPAHSNDAGFGLEGSTSIHPTDSTKDAIHAKDPIQQGSAPGNTQTTQNSTDVKDSGLSHEKRANPSATKEHKILSKTGFYWGLHTYSICASLLIDTLYWTLIWPSLPTTPAFYLIQFIEHGLNLPLMIADYCLVAFPVILPHLWFTTVISIFYILWNYIWYAAGGKNDDRSKHYLYSFLDWEKPGEALTFGFFISLGLTLFLFVILLVDHCKFKCRPKVLMNVAQKSPPLP